MDLTGNIANTFMTIEILKSAINAHNKMKGEEREGKKIYRKREWRRDERRQEREKRKKNWYTKGEYKSVLFIQLHRIQNWRRITRRDR